MVQTMRFPNNGFRNTRYFYRISCMNPLLGVFVKISDFIKFKVFLVEFLENRRP